MPADRPADHLGTLPLHFGCAAIRLSRVQHAQPHAQAVVDRRELLPVLPQQIGCCCMKNRDVEHSAGAGHGEQGRAVWD